MRKNFRVGQANELIKDDRIYDLHNCFDFECLVVSGGGDIELVFKPNPEHGEGYSRIAVRVQSVDYLEISPQFGAARITDIDEIGYKLREDRDDSWLLTEIQATEKADVFIRFLGGHFVRFHGEDASLLELHTSPAFDSPP